MAFETISIVFLFFSGCVGITAGLSVWNNKFSEQQFAHGLLFFSAGYNLLYSGLAFSGLLWKVPWLFLTHFPFMYTIGPSFYVFLNGVVTRESQSLAIKRVILWPFLVIFVACLAINYFFHAQVDANMAAYVQGGVFSWVHMGYLAFTMIFITFVIRFLFEHQLFFSTSPFQIPFLAQVGLVGVLLVLIGAVIGSVFSVKVGCLAGANFGGMQMMAVYFIGQRNPRLLYDWAEVVQKKKYAGSRLTADESAQIGGMVHQLLDRDKLYRDPDITLRQLADEIGVPQTYVSQAINQEFKQNFNMFVNRYRVEEAKVLLRENTAFTVSSIAFEVGFQSVSSFYNAFNKVTNSTPSSYRKSFLVTEQLEGC